MVQLSWRWFRLRPAAFRWLATLGGSRTYPSAASPHPADVPPAPTREDRTVEAAPVRARPALRMDAGAHLRYPLGASPRPSLAMDAEANLAAFRQPTSYGGDGAAS